MTRGLSEQEAAAALARATPIPAGRSTPRRPRTALRGLDPRGADVMLQLTGASLVVFLSTTCDACSDLASLVREGAVGFSVLGVLRVPTGGLPSDETSSFVGSGGRWLLGDDAFEAFEVSSAPFFCIIDAAGTLVVEGVAFAESHVEDHCARVLAGEPRPDAVRLVDEDG